MQIQRGLTGRGDQGYKENIKAYAFAEEVWKNVEHEILNESDVQDKVNEYLKTEGIGLYNDKDYDNLIYTIESWWKERHKLSKYKMKKLARRHGSFSDNSPFNQDK